MVKNYNSHRKVLLERNITSLLYQIELVESYVSVAEKQLTDKMNRRIENYKLNFQDELLQNYHATLSNSSLIKEMTEDDFKKQDNKLYWKKRAINTSFKRKYKMKEDQEQHQDELNKLIINAELKADSKKKALLKKYDSRNLTDEQIKMNKLAYEEKLAAANQAISVYEDQQKHILDQKMTKIKLRLEIKKNKLIKKLNIKNTQMEKLLNDPKSKLAFSEDVMNETAILKIDHLTMQFGGLKAVDDLSFEVKKGEVFGLIGPNGAGKTTVFNCITQFYKPPLGNIYYRNSLNDILLLNDFKVHNVVKQGIVRTFQNVELIWELSILDNMLVGAHSLYRSTFLTHSFQTFGFKREEAILKSKAEKILSDLDLIAYKDFYPVGLPYGILKKIELARTLMTNPNLIILDEPAAGLNDSETESLALTIKQIQKDYNCTIFLVEHDMGLVMNICDTICAISFGKKLAIGTPKEIQSNKLVQEAYLGGE